MKYIRIYEIECVQCHERIMRGYSFSILRSQWHSPHACEHSYKKFDPSEIFLNFAKAGFYYHDNAIHCFACFLKIDDWFQIRNPLLIHCLTNPHCSFLRKEIGEEGIFDICSNYSQNFDSETFICTTCTTNPIDRFLSCGHTVCSKCLTRLTSCPTCRLYITNQNGITRGGYNPKSG